MRDIIKLFYGSLRVNLSKTFILLPFLLFLINVSYGQFTREFGGIVRGDRFTKNLALVFTGHDYNDGSEFILETLKKEEMKASFFLTGDFYRNPANRAFINTLKENDFYLGPHSDKHLLYSSRENRDSLLVDKTAFERDLQQNYKAMENFGIKKEAARYFIPPFEYYNDSITNWAKNLEVTLVNITPGIDSNSDLTDSTMENYVSSDEIYTSIYNLERSEEFGLNGYILLMHVGVGDIRTDKFYYKLPFILQLLKRRGYNVVTIKELLEINSKSQTTVN